MCFQQKAFKMEEPLQYLWILTVILEYFKMEEPLQYLWILTVILSSLAAIWYIRRCTSAHSSSSTRVHALRLSPGEEIKTSLLNYCRQNSIDAAYIITCVGSLSKIHLRYAYSSGHFDKESWSRGQVIDGQFEILSMVGTIDGRGEFTFGRPMPM